MVKEGFPYVLVPAVFALLFAYFQLWAVAGLLAAVAGFMAFFFRDPYRDVPEGDDIIVSAADGKVTRISEDEKGKLVSVFLSPFDVHVNRSPIAGIVERVEFIPGRKVPATRGDASLVNERNSLTIKGERMTVVCTQIAGIVARRIVCWNDEGDSLALGQRFGLIKFSSRTDLLMPHQIEILVKVGDRVVGGETIIGRLPRSEINGTAGT
ncbi:MAG TPA: phosphatidylserine decarboxylase [Pyrinomonadaceae bacterium]|nr:phosphatidylserine decarboxylase [Pyrinomonadaceae bacterium]HMP67074.1 phosphatidylserine decarboxylase [Pyrinomonadaceae bacterium]